VARFLDNPPMNLFPGAVVAGDRLCLNDSSMPLPQASSSWARPGRQVTVGLHAEAVYLVRGTPPKPEPSGFRLRGVVDLVEPDIVHRTQLVHLKTGRFEYAAVAALDIPLYVRDEVEVVLPADQLYFFDTKNERRIG
jgi:ABC-type sugar transport system ATPase subunit